MRKISIDQSSYFGTFFSPDGSKFFTSYKHAMTFWFTFFENDPLFKGIPAWKAVSNSTFYVNNKA